MRVPRSGYRTDVAALTRKPGAPEARSALFECKQSRADFLRDQVDEPAAQAKTRALFERLRALRALLAIHRPDLRRDESLFPEFDSYDFAGMRHETLHGLEAELEALQRKLLFGVKFSRLHKYHAADFLYLVTEPDILAPHEVPAGWGWLVREGAVLVLREPPLRHPMATRAGPAWLENIALAGSAASFRALGGLRRPRKSSASG